MPNSDAFMCAARHAKKIGVDLTWTTRKNRSCILAAVEAYQDSKRVFGRTASLHLREEVQNTIKDALDTSTLLRQYIEAAALGAEICTGNLTDEQKLQVLDAAEKQIKKNQADGTTGFDIIISSFESILENKDAA